MRNEWNGLAMGQNKATRQGIRIKVKRKKTYGMIKPDAGRHQQEREELT
jgi:hypothetical protein